MKLLEAIKLIKQYGFTIYEAKAKLPTEPKRFEVGDEVIMTTNKDGAPGIKWMGEVVSVTPKKGTWVYGIDWHYTNKVNMVAEEYSMVQYMYGTHGKPYYIPAIDVFADFEMGNVLDYGHEEYKYDLGWYERNWDSGRFKGLQGVRILKATDENTKHVFFYSEKGRDKVDRWKKENPNIKVTQYKGK